MKHVGNGRGYDCVEVLTRYKQGPVTIKSLVVCGGLIDFVDRMISEGELWSCGCELIVYEAGSVMISIDEDVLLEEEGEGWPCRSGGDGSGVPTYFDAGATACCVFGGGSYGRVE